MRLRGRELSSAERKRRQRSHEGAVDSVAKSPKLSNFAAGMTGKAMFSIFGAIFDAVAEDNEGAAVEADRDLAVCGAHREHGAGACVRAEHG